MGIDYSNNGWLADDPCGMLHNNMNNIVSLAGDKNSLSTLSIEKSQEARSFSKV